MLLDVGEDIAEQCNVAVDQIEPAGPYFGSARPLEGPVSQAGSPSTIFFH